MSGGHVVSEQRPFSPLEVCSRGRPPAKGYPDTEEPKRFHPDKSCTDPQPAYTLGLSAPSA